ncbi:hypothetical protein GLAREA_05856 [Glarea lozoyensis ATCC 20868]|uniref:DUF7730 domain-containing protein n=1 Tax=Glarea lozoyensis (strain ATCC 20868 / MF5171) TaxID=1116229 RepID=S3D6V2_GLAL2|nr:uncharacterized protein GLAREA_05856 [Glarea lozoyensis ATCC 20868]EPE32844.1 hypothetical protein GLAREA_05856 [Glarea lozoyensis ATCC 20868]
MSLAAKKQPKAGQNRDKHSSVPGRDYLTSLPLEIQVIIYKYVLYSSWSRFSTIHILRPKHVSYDSKGKSQRDRLSMSPCSVSSHDVSTQSATAIWQQHMRNCTYYGLGLPYLKTGDTLRTYRRRLLHTCKIIYAISVELAHSYFTFNILNFGTAYLFLTRTPKSMLNMLKRLNLNWVVVWPLRSSRIQPSKKTFKLTEKSSTLEDNWGEICSVLECMQGLTELKIWLSYSPSKIMEEALLSPLANITVDGVFVLELPHVPERQAWPEMAVERPGVSYTMVRRSHAEEELIADVYVSGGGPAFIEHRFVREPDITILKCILGLPWLLIKCGVDYVAELARRRNRGQ